MLNIVRTVLVCCVLCIVCCFSNRAIAGGPENLLLVVNRDDPSSMLIANYYAHHRNIPARNIVLLSGISPEEEECSQNRFKHKIMGPIIEAIRERNLGKQIDYVVYSSGFPSVVVVSDHYNRLVAELKKSNGGKVQNLQLIRPQVSLTAITYFFKKALADDPTYLGLGANRYMRGSCRQLLDAPFLGPDELKFEKAMDHYAAERYSDAAKVLEPLAEKHTKQYAVHYWLARVSAKQNDANAALNWMTRAIRAGWEFRDYTRSDPAFESLKDDSLFQAVVGRIADRPFVFVPTHGFRSTYHWGPNGLVNNGPASGDGYVLSTMLSVTRNQGMSEQQTLDYLSRSIAADGAHPKGTFFFTKTSDVRTRTRLPNFPLAIAELKKMGFSCKIVSGLMPKNESRVMGVTMGASKFDWKKSGSTFVRGAIGENLTSYGGKLAPGASQTKLFEFLKYGAAGSSGTVVEPYAVQPKFPHPRIHVHYARGCTLAEAFYQSVQGPFQLLIVGDALCQPWAVKPELDIVTRYDKTDPKKWLTLSLNADESPVKIGRLQYFMDGQLFKTTRFEANVRFATSNWPDGYHELRVVPIASNAIETQNSYPFDLTIDNRGHSLKLTAKKKEFSYADRIELAFDATGSSQVDLLHHAEVVASSPSAKGSFLVDASLIGRGPITLQAVTTIAGKRVYSAPLKLNINGKVSTEVPVYHKKKPKKK